MPWIMTVVAKNLVCRLLDLILILDLPWEGCSWITKPISLPYSVWKTSSTYMFQASDQRENPQLNS